MKDINLHIYAKPSDQSIWNMDIKVDCATVQHERCDRSYSSPGDAITSSRHLVNELMAPAKKGAKA